MIAPQFNRHTSTSISQIADLIRYLVQKRDPAAVELAENVGTTEGLVAYIQMRLSPVPDPNCVERAAIYLDVRELLSSTVHDAAKRHEKVAGRENEP